MATIEVSGSPPGRIFANKVVTGAELKSRTPTGIPLDFAMPGGYLIETRVFFHGRGTLRAGPVKVEALHLAPGRPFPSWALALGWVSGTVLFGWLFVHWYRRDDELVGQQ